MKTKSTKISNGQDKCTVISFALVAFILLSFNVDLYSQVQWNNTIITGTYSSAIGSQSESTGNYSFSAGLLSKAYGISSISLGNKSVADGHYSMSLGESCFSGSQSYSIGQNAKAKGQQSFAIGRFVETATSSANSFIIGSGSSQFIMQNNISNSLMIGFNSSVPTFFIGPSSGTGSGIGMVGIGTTAPQANLHIKSLINENAILFIETGSWNSSKNAVLNMGNIMHGITSNMNSGLTFRTQKYYIFDQGNVGIGTTTPIHPLHVDGNVMITGLNSSLLFADALSAGGSWGKWGIEYETNGLNFWRPYENEKPETKDSEAKGGAQNYILFLNDDGNIGIGTNKPLEKLHVMGKSLFQAVGIGIDVPMSELHVVGRAIISENLTIGNLQRPGTLAVTGQAVFGSSVQIASLASDYEKMIVADSDGVLSTAEMPIGDQMGSHIASQYLQMRGNFITNDADEGNTEGIFIGTAGNVGIKTNDIQDIDDLTVSSPTGKNQVSLRVKGHSNKPATAWMSNGNKTIGMGVEGEKGYIYEYHNNNTSKIITFKDGRVGIGDLTNGSNEITMTGDHKLFVSGGITAEEVKVKLKAAWSDYVFFPDYQLKSLAEVESFIKQNGHLPEVPNAKTVEENGIELGEMNALLLRKIEELTLYILEQEKRIKALEEK